MRSTILPRFLPVRLSLLFGVSLLLAGCAGNRAGEEDPPPPGDADAGSAPDGSVVVRMAESGGTSPGAPGTRQITTLGLPSDMVIHYPDWIVNPGIEGILGAIGVADASPLGSKFQIEEARLAGRLELARMLETRVQSVGRAELEEHRHASGDPIDPDTEARARRSRLGVDRDITDIVLSGSRQRALWFDPLSSDCYVWVVMDGGVPGMADHSIENGTSIYVANRPIASEYRPERQPEPRAPVSEPPAPPVVAPDPELTPIEKLEENLQPIKTIPVKDEE